MASDFDELVKQLQYDLALAGEEGLSYSQLAQKVHAFYDSKNALINDTTTSATTHAEDLLFSEEPPESVVKVTDHFVESAWEWLSKLKDVSITAVATSPGSRHPGERLVASIEHLWFAVTGHSIDKTRVKNAEFTLLHIIAKHGPPGIAQPDLVKESGQDKRSVPQRTDNLTKRGYITKVPVISKGAKTSLLKLHKYSEAAATLAAAPAAISDRVIFYDQWYDKMMQALNANGRSMTIDDLRTVLDIPSRHWQVKALQRCLRRLETSKCVRRIRAQVEGKKPGDRGFYLRSVELMRQPTDSDRILFMMHSGDANAKDSKTRVQVVKEPADDDEDEDDNDDEFEIDNTVNVTEKTPRIVAHWTPDLPLANFIFDMVEHAGVAGLSIMDLHKHGVGPAWRRPVDEELIRLCDKWQTSQPKHLRHLTLMKDTATTDRFTFFKYRTYANFEKAVQNGDAFWEAVQYKSKKKGSETSATPLDAYGFPVLPKSLFAGNRDGTARLELCVRNVDKKSLPSNPAASRDRFWAEYRKHKATEKTRPPVQVASTSGDQQFGQLAKRKALAQIEPRPYKRQKVHRPTVSAAMAEPVSTSDAHSGSVMPDPANAPIAPAISTTEIDSAATSHAAEVAVYAHDPVQDAHPILGTNPAADPELLDLSITRAGQNVPTTGPSISETSEPQASGGALREKLSRKSYKERYKQSLMVSINSRKALNARNNAMPDKKGSRSNLVITIKSQRLHELPCFTGSGKDDKVSGSPAVVAAPAMNGNRTTAPSVGTSGLSLLPSQTQDDLGGSIDTDGDAMVTESNGTSNGVSASAAEHTQYRLPTDRAGVHAGTSSSTAIDVSSTASPATPGHRLAPQQDNKSREALSIPTIEIVGSDSQVLGRKGMSRSGGTVSVKRTQVIMDVLRQCNGLYPGNKEIYHPVALALSKVNGTVADLTTIDNSINGMLFKAQLRKMVFTFHDDKGMQWQRSIITDPSIAPGDPRVAAMQQKIIDAHPHRYHPPEAEIPADMRAALDYKIATKLSRDPSNVDVEAPVQNTGANADNFPLVEAVIVKRTGQSRTLDNDGPARANSVAENSPRPARTTKLTRQDSMKDSDDDISEPEPEQIKSMEEFQVLSYKHDDTHAFTPRKPRSRIGNRSTLSTFFNPVKKSTTKPSVRAPIKDGTPEMSARASSGLTSATQFTKDMPERSMHLMFSPDSMFHAPSGTIGSVAAQREPRDVVPKTSISAPMGYNMFHNTFQVPGDSLPTLAPPAGRTKPLTRLQSLGSGLLNYNKHRSNALLSQQVSESTQMVRPEPVRPPKRTSTAIEPINEAPVKKRKTKVYKSMRGNKTALGVEESTRIADEPTFEIADHNSFVAGPGFAVNKKRDRKGPQMFQESDRLTTAVALYRLILGGMDQRNNWGVIAHMLDFRYEADFLRRRWDSVKNAKETGVRDTMEAMYDTFLEAYESGKLSAIDFADLNATDWPAVLKWFEHEIATAGRSQEPVAVKLPRSLTKFQAAYSVTEEASVWEQAKEAWFTTPIEKLRKDLAHVFVYGCALPGHLRPTVSFFDDKLVLKTWIRAVAATKTESYNSRLAAAKLDVYSQDAIKAACDELVASKTIRHMHKGRQQPGRNFEIHDAHWTLFRRWPGKTIEWKYVRDLATARHNILQRFENAERMAMDFHADDAEIAVLINFVDQGILRVVSDLPERNDDFEAPFPKISATGYSGYNYNAKTLDREKLRFPVVFERAEKFTLEHGLVGGVPIPLQPLPADDDGRLPFWMDIHGHLLPDIWDLVLRSILHLVVFRTGCTARAMEVSHSHKLMTWEVNLALDWMEKSGIALRCGVGEEVDGVWTGGWKASEWWYCAFEPEMTFWKTT